MPRSSFKDTGKSCCCDNITSCNASSSQERSCEVHSITVWDASFDLTELRACDAGANLPDEYVLWKVAPQNPFVFDWQLSTALTRGDSWSGLAKLRNTRRTSAQNRVARLGVDLVWKKGGQTRTRQGSPQFSHSFLTLHALRTTTLFTSSNQIT
jgi:hypothetical protein